MDNTYSKFSEAGESGWTTYLGHSSGSRNHFGGYNGGRKYFEEDLSMVSDASSCPRYLYEEEEEEYNSSESEKKKIKESYGRFYQQDFSCLDDTASSKASYQNLSLGRNEASMEFSSQGYSATKFKEKLGMQQTSGFNQSIRVGKKAKEEQGSSKQRKKRG